MGREPQGPALPAPERALSVPQVVLVAGFGFLVGGWPGLVLAGATALLAPSPDGPRWAGAAAVGFLALAALATALPELGPPTPIGLDYASDRPLASATARLAGLAALVALLAGVRAERAPATGGAMGGGRGQGATVRSLREGLPFLAAVQFLGVVVLALVVHASNTPTPLSPAEAALVDHLQAGAGYTVGGTAGRPVPSAMPPLGPLVAAFSPVSLGTTALVAWSLAVVALMDLAQRLAGGRAALAAGLLAAALQAWVGPDLAQSLALLLVTVGLRLAWPPQTLGRLGVAGACLGAAALARPDAILVLPMVALAVARSRRSLVVALALVAAATVVVLPWQLWLHRRFDTWIGVIGPSPGRLTWSLPVLAVLTMVGVGAWHRRLDRGSGLRLGGDRQQAGGGVGPAGEEPVEGAQRPGDPVEGDAADPHLREAQVLE